MCATVFRKGLWEAGLMCEGLSSARDCGKQDGCVWLYSVGNVGSRVDV
ncbi:MAG: hypothetical protein NC121_15905 [Blautia sp.]|nr:hypothetical protein [Blautia sp.]